MGKTARRVPQNLLRICLQSGRRLSGEHGIGAKKIDALAAYCDPVEMSIMKTIKRAMDPNNILNPGKLIRA